jgi:peptide/nickel transport system permease protein
VTQVGRQEVGNAGLGKQPRVPRLRRDARHARSWRRWAALRAVQLVPVVVGVVLTTFLLIHLVPGDPALSILGVHATPESVAALRKEMHLDQPFFEQLWLFISQLAHGSLGNSLVQDGRSVTSIVFPAMGVTLLLTAVAVLFSLLIGIPLGLAAALWRRRGVDVAVRSLAAALLATPPFLLGFFLLLFVALKSALAPAGGWGSGFASDLAHVWLPALALAGYLTPIVVRAVRQSALETASEQFVEAAVARGLRQRTLVFRHILPNSLLPVITLVGVNVGGLISGAVVIEAVFALPGTGSALVQAVETRDYPVVQGVALLAAVLVVLVTLLTDALYLIVDPRTRSAT